MRLAADFCPYSGVDRVEGSPADTRCLRVGYTNGSIGYVPISPAYAEGGYEVTHACRVAPEAAGIIEDTTVRLDERLCGGA